MTRDLIEALDEPSLVIGASIVRIANAPARELLGSRIEGRDVRLVIRHPQALQRIVNLASGDLEVTGIGEVGRAWRLLIRKLGKHEVLVRMIDRSQAVSAEKMRVDFVANASHELRTPLSTVIGYAETLAEEDDLPENLRSNFGRTIRDEARRMLSIIEDLMSLSRIEADRFLAPGTRVDIASIVEVATANARRTPRGGSCRLELQMASDLPPVRGDHGQLVQVLDNLLNNALRYACDRPDSQVTVAVKAQGPSVTLTVTDQGPGVAKDHIPRLTERFYRVDPARSRESGGTGLGLAIVKHIVERHRGRLEISSTVGVGTSVSVSLPAD